MNNIDYLNSRENIENSIQELSNQISTIKSQIEKYTILKQFYQDLVDKTNETIRLKNMEIGDLLTDKFDTLFSKQLLDEVPNIDDEYNNIGELSPNVIKICELNGCDVNINYLDNDEMSYIIKRVK